jgi:DUF4097 and DUF4098 domain-containing protein YvlB
MNIHKTAVFSVLVLAALALAVLPQTPVEAQKWTVLHDDDWCDEWRGDNDAYCEVRKLVIADAWKRVTVDGRMNGGITVEGWDKDEMEIRAKVKVWDRDEDDAREVAGEIEIETGHNKIQAKGPHQGRHRGWSVSYELKVPRKTDLDLETLNGGIRIYSVEGEILAEATNGGLKLEDVAGDVRGRTTNGGLNVRLEGRTWKGEGLEVSTTNGGVKLYIPENYSAELETGTVNGSIDIDFPVMVQGKINKKIRATLGDGGPKIRVTTTNGGVRIKRD